MFYSTVRRTWVARKTVNGQKVERTGKTQDAAIKKRDAALPPGPGVTVGEWCTRWLSSLRVRPATMVQYQITVTARMVPAFGDVKLVQLTAWHIENAAAQWSNPSSDSPLSPGTLKKTLAHVSSCLEAAVRARIITHNPASLVRRPRVGHTKFDLFSPAELRRIIDHAATCPHWYPFAICAATGCRIGEALALRPADFNPKTGMLAIERTRTPHGLGPPKSARGVREIRVPALIAPILEAGFPEMNHDAARYRWKGFLAELELRYRNLHQLRHSVATHAIAAKVPLPNVARDLGDCLQTIVNTYLHPTLGDDVCGAMERLFCAGTVKKPESSKRAQRPTA